MHSNNVIGTVFFLSNVIGTVSNFSLSTLRYGSKPVLVDIQIVHRCVTIHKHVSNQQHITDGSNVLLSNRFHKLSFVSSSKFEDIFQTGYVITIGRYYNIRKFKDVIEIYVLHGVLLSGV